MTEADQLDDIARDLAARFREPAWVIARPPEGPPYAARESDTTPEERASEGAKRFEP